MNKKILVIAFLGLFSSCSSQAQLSSTLGKVLGGLQNASTSTGTNNATGSNNIADALKQALTIGISNGSAEASKMDGFFKNELIKLAVPPEALKVTQTLRKLGFGSEVDKFTLSLNRAAEDAAKKAKPIFVKSITSMTIPDALTILKGSDDAATQYLKKTTNQELYDTFYPVVDSTLKLNKATEYYSSLVTQYNKLPMVKKVNPNLKEYATQKTIDGLYTLIAQEEKKIRVDPAARVTDLLKSVFSSK